MCEAPNKKTSINGHCITIIEFFYLKHEKTWNEESTLTYWMGG